MGWWPCLECCPRECTIVLDDFNRSNSTNVGSQWIEEVGDSEIVGNTIRIPAGGSVRTVESHPTAEASGVVTATLKDIQSGKRFRITINHLDEDNYVFGDILFVALGGGEPDDLGAEYELGVRVGGTDTVTDSGSFVTFSAGDDSSLSICKSKESTFLSPADSAQIVFSCHLDTGGRHAGLVNTGGGDIEFDNFDFSEHHNTNPKCSQCGCECGGINCLPKVLTLTILASGICADCLDGINVTLTFDIGVTEFMTWSGVATNLPATPDFGCDDDPSETGRFRLECRDDLVSGKKWFLCDEIACGTLPEGIDCDFVFPTSNTKGNAEVGYTCRPLVIEFPEHGCGSIAGECRYYFIITGP